MGVFELKFLDNLFHHNNSQVSFSSISGYNDVCSKLSEETALIIAGDMGTAGRHQRCDKSVQVGYEK
jgi:hypothetical protein